MARSRMIPAASIVLALAGASCGDSDPAPPSPSFVIVKAGALTTSESGATATLTVALRIAPTAPVDVTLAIDDTSEVGVSPTTLAFDDTNWSTPQTVTLTGLDDELDDGDQTTFLTLDPTSADADYEALATASVPVTNTDDELPGFTLSPGTLAIWESGSPATFTVALITQPTADVTFTVESLDLTEATVSPATLTFTVGGWSDGQTVTVTPVPDFMEDWDQTFGVRLTPASDDGAYAALGQQNVVVTCNNTDYSTFTVTPATLVTGEPNVSTTFQVALTVRPWSDVTFSAYSSDETEGIVSPTSVTFTYDDWSTPKAFTVTGVDDAVADGPQTYTVTVHPYSTDLNYGLLGNRILTFTNTDDD